MKNFRSPATLSEQIEDLEFALARARMDSRPTDTIDAHLRTKRAEMARRDRENGPVACVTR